MHTLSKNPQIEKLLAHYQKIALFNDILALLGWDLNVNLPPQAGEGRANQSAFITEQITNLWKNKEFMLGIQSIHENDEKLTETEKAIIRNLKHTAKYFSSLPEKLIIEREKVTSEAFMVWQEAKPKNAYSKFSPYLDKIIEINKKTAHFLGYENNPYDPLLDMYEQGLTAAYIQKQFDMIKPSLIALIQRIKKSKNYTNIMNLSHYIDGSKNYPESNQKELNKRILNRMKFDFTRGRIDISSHPFTTTLGKNDIRFTVKYKQNDFRDAISSGMHEGGHALYEQKINPSFYGTPLGGGVSLGIHEGMSRFYENQIGRSPQLLTFLTSTFQEIYAKELKETTADTFIHLFNFVKPGFIRIEADEVTYTLHIILRFEMENDLINGKITVEDAPKVWNKKMKEYLGIEPTTDTDGILQDVHWAYGSIGYFPSYALGNLYASQFLSYMKKDISVEENLLQGNLGTITQWLSDNVYIYGSLYWPKDLVKKVTGEELNAKYFMEYLEKKYTTIYQLEEV